MIEGNTHGGDWMFHAEDQLVRYLQNRHSAEDRAREY